MDSDQVLFYFKNELTATEMFEMLQKAFGNECLSRTNVFEWYGKYCNGRESVGDDPRAGRPPNQTNTGTHCKVCAALADDQRSTIRMLADWFHIDKETVCKIITEDLGQNS